MVRGHLELALITGRTRKGRRDMGTSQTHSSGPWVTGDVCREAGAVMASLAKAKQQDLCCPCVKNEERSRTSAW